MLAGEVPGVRSVAKRDGELVEVLDEVAEVVGVQLQGRGGERRRIEAEEPDDVDSVIEKALSINDVPVVVEFVVHKDAMVWPMVAAGTSNDEIKVARDMAPNWDDEVL